MISETLRKVVNVILIYHREIFQESLSLMKLQKLCYYTQGVYMATHNGAKLFEEDFEAWNYGPVIRSLYQEFKHYAWKTIEDEVELPNLEEDKLDCIKTIVETYGRYDGAALMTMTHREEPWLKARKGLTEIEGSNELIVKDSIKTFFENKLATQHG
jgi:uncharacterized phage-associated protein